jgi:anti-sigma regulatory factor (Ser/Thr protein kinase)
MGSSLHLVLHGDASAGRVLREEVRQWLAGARVNGATGEAIVSAVSEAFTNAVEHPVERTSDDVAVDGQIESNEVVLRVRDDGRWQHNMDPARGHYGFRLMEALMDSVVIDRADGGTLVTLRRAILR